MKIIISGGGSGGHLYPALAIANALKEKGVSDILFVGAKGKIEMEKVPKAGFKIEGLWISGFHRQKKWRNFLFPIKLILSLLKAKKIIDKFRPDLVVGVGGFASGPILKVAQWKGIPTAIQEQNSYPGVTNKLLSKGANKIMVAYPGMRRYFEDTKITITGNPVRKDLMQLDHLKNEAISYFDLDKNKKTILIFGGSLGARSINEAVLYQKELIEQNPQIQIIWQVGKIYYPDYKDSEFTKLTNVKILPFIDRMDLAYCAADITITRAGALTISELTLTGHPAILVPSPNVAEDHQTKNAKALTDNNAGILVQDNEAKKHMIPKAFELLDNDDLQKELSKNIRALSKPDAREQIADLLIEMVQK